MQDYVEISLGKNTYKLDQDYKNIAKRGALTKEEILNLRQAHTKPNFWRDENQGVIESLEGKFFVLCSSFELDGIDLVFEKKVNENGDEVYCLTENSRKLIFPDNELV